MCGFFKKFIDRYKKMDIVTKSSIWFVFANILHKCIQFIVVPMYTRILPVEEYGIYTLFQSWLSIVNIIATLNLAGAAFDKGLMKFRSERNQFVSSMQGLTITVTILVAGCWYFAGKGIFEHLGISVKYMGLILICCVFSSAFGFWSIREKFEQRFRKLVGITVAISFLTPVLGLCMTKYVGKRGIAPILGYACIQIAVGMFFMISGFAQGKKFYVKKHWQFALTFCIPLLPHFISCMILNQSDRVMIGSICGESQAAIYSVANNVAMAANALIGGINSALIPFTYQSLEEKKYENLNVKTDKTLDSVFGIMCVILAFAPEIVHVLGGQAYYSAIWVIPPLIVSTYLNFIISRYTNVQYHYEENKFIMSASIVAAMFNVGLNMFYIPRYGFIAAGYTTLVCNMTWTISHYIFMTYVCKKHSERKVYNNRHIFIMVTSLFLIAAGFLMVYRFTHIRYLIIGVLTIIGVCSWKKLRSIS